MHDRIGNKTATLSIVGIAALSILFVATNIEGGAGYVIGWALPWTIVVAVFLLAASRALILRQVITVRLRRSQALGIGLTAAGLALFSSIFIDPFNPEASPGASVTSDLFFLVFFLFPWLVFFYWADASVLNAVRSDPLVRDILHWRSARKWVWGLLVSMISLFLVWGIVVVGILGPRPNDVVDSTIGAVSIFTTIGIPFITGLVLLPFAVRRSRDPTIKRHLRWFGYFVGFLGLGVVGIFFEDLTNALLPVWQILWVVSGYCLYKSAGALVVLNQIPIDKESAAPRMPAGEAWLP